VRFVFKYANDAISTIRTADVMMAFNLHLQCTLQAAQCGLAEFANGFLTQGALVLFEDEQMTQSKQEFSAIRQLIAVVQALSCFDAEMYLNLAKRISQHASKLLVLDYQSRATVLCAYLFATTGKNAGLKDSKLAMQCLKKAMQICGSVVDVDLLVQLYIDLLDHYVYFFDKHPDVVDAKYVNAIIVKIHKHVSTNNIDKSHASLVHLRNIQAFVSLKQNWENLVKKDKVKKEGKEGVEVEGETGLAEHDAKSEAERWKEISFANT